MCAEKSIVTSTIGLLDFLHSVLFSENIQNYSSIYQNSGVTYNNMTNVTIDAVVYSHSRITVSEYGEMYHIFFSV